MTPLAHFESVWARCAQLSALHAYLAANVAGVLQPDELLRAEWVARVSALDLYIHEFVAQKMLDIFLGLRPSTPAYRQFQISNETIARIRAASSPGDAGAAFDLDVRNQLSYVTYQDPDKIADGIRLCSSIELWNSVAVHLGATQAAKAAAAKTLKTELSLVVRRRNKIAHEGDLQPSPPRVPWAIGQADLMAVETLIERIVRAIDTVAT